MSNQQPQWPSESEDEKSMPAARQRISFRWFGCPALILIVVIVIGAAIFLANGASDDQFAGRNNDVPATETPAATRRLTDRPADDTLTGDLNDSEAASEDATAELATQSLEAGQTVAAEPAATEPPATKPPAAPTVESVPTEPAAAPAPPSASPDNVIVGRIAVVDNRSQLWTVAADGSDRRLLSEPGRFYQFPSWSPVGNDIAVIGSDSAGGGVYVIADEQDSEMRQLYSDANSLPIYLYWSPEAESVSFIAGQAEGLDLHLAPADGSANPEVVATSPGTFFWDWMPDGSQVLVHTGFSAIESEESRLAFVQLDDLDAPQEIAQSGYFQAPAVSADGRYFSYSDLDADGNRRLSIQDIDVGQRVETVRHQGVVAMGFSPTSAQLAFTSPARPSRTFYGALRLIDLASGDTRVLVQAPVVAFFWSPDGRSIAYLTPSIIERPFDFDEAPVAGLDREFTSWQPNQHGPAKPGILGKATSFRQPETRFGLALSIVDVESGARRQLTTFEPGAVFLNQFLPFFDQYAHSHRLWSPDSRALVLPIRDDQNRNVIVVVPVDGGDPLPISPGVVAFWSQQ